MAKKEDSAGKVNKKKSPRPFRISAGEARKVAYLHLKRSKTLKGWYDAFAGRVFPFFTPDDKKNASFYEVKVSTPDRENAGTIIVSATDEDFPVVTFRASGLTLAEELKLKTGHAAVRFIWHGLWYVSAEDEEGKEIIRIGRSGGLYADEEDIEAYNKENSEAVQLNKQVSAKEKTEEWEEVKAYLAGMLKFGNPGPDAASFGYIWGWSRHPNFGQFDLPSGNPIGCGATAWSALVAYADLHWDPDFMYGTHRDMDEGDSAADGYVQRSMKLFHGKLPTDSNGNNKFKYQHRGYKIFDDYHLFGHLSIDGLYDYDLSVFVGSGPKQGLLDLILDKGFENDYPAIIGLTKSPGTGKKKKKFFGHSCLGLGWALNSGGNLKYVMVHRCWGKGKDDQWYTHKSRICGAWILPRGGYTRPRETKETDTPLFGRIDMASLDGNLYIVGWRRCDEFPDPNPRIIIRKAKGTGYEIPEKGSIPPKITYEEEIEVPVFSIMETESQPLPGISVCTYKDVVKWYEWFEINIPGGLEVGVDLTNPEHGFEELESDFLHAVRSGFRDREIPYLLLIWSDLDDRIHIAYTIIRENLNDCDFKHVLLPERFQVQRLGSPTPDIAIAKIGNGQSPPLLLVAYADSASYLFPPPYDQGLSNVGRLLMMKFDKFLEIARIGDDLWPLNSVPQFETTTVTLEKMGGAVQTEMQVHNLAEYWCPFDSQVMNVRLTSYQAVGHDFASLLWEKGGSLHLLRNLDFKPTDDYEISHPSFHMPVLGSTKIEIAYAKYGGEFLSSVDHEYTEGDEWFGYIQSAEYSRPGFLRVGRTILITWADPPHRILVACIKRGTRRACLLADLFKTGSDPCIHYVTDELGNKDFVLAWKGFGLGPDVGTLITRILYFSGSDVPGITDYDKLPDDI